MAGQVGTKGVAAARDRRGLRALVDGLARVLPDRAPRLFVVRAALGLVALAGAAWFVAIAVLAAGTAFGYSPAPGVAGAVAAIILAPAALAFAAPLLGAYLALTLGKVAPETWSGIMTASLAALILACCATVLDATLWPGIGVLLFVAVLGFLFGFRRWQPRLVAADRPAKLPLVLLLVDEPRAGERATAAVAQPVTEERKAA
jgi:hypothetical protein